MLHCSVVKTCAEIPLGATCYRFPNYIEPGDWHNTPGQRALMLTYAESDVVEERNRLSH